jgi:hypothetical protein
MKAACSFERLEATTLLQAAYGSHHIGSFENFYQLVEDALIVLRTGLQVFFQYELRLANCLNSQLLISHTRYSQSAPPKRKEANQDLIGVFPRFFAKIISIFVSVLPNIGGSAASVTS